MTFRNIGTQSSRAPRKKGPFAAWHLIFAALLGAVLFGAEAEAGFRITVNGGTLLGPGARGTHVLQQGSLENFVLTAPLTGVIPFANNGAGAPNVRAEVLFGGPVDGQLSDGSKINENVDAAFVVAASDPTTGKHLRLLIASISEERVESDPLGNLTFSLTVGFDGGDSGKVPHLSVQLVTGAMVIPVSLKTQQGRAGGQDRAAWLVSGSAVIGRLGDFDQDGLLDGTFVLAGDVPAELEIIGGDPVVIIRPFTSDIPVVPVQAAFFALNGIARNFALPEVKKTFEGGGDAARDHLVDISERLDAALENIHRSIGSETSSERKGATALLRVRGLIEGALRDAGKAMAALSAGRHAEGKRTLEVLLTAVESALSVIVAEIK